MSVATNRWPAGPFPGWNHPDPSRHLPPAAGRQVSLLDLTEPGFADVLTSVSRRDLGAGAWLDYLPGWLTGSDDILTHLLETVPWRAERRRMYDRVVDVPRLVAWYGAGVRLPHPVLTQARDALSHYYDIELVTAGLCLYRDGHDSVAWHGDRIGRGAVADTVVAIVSVGEPRSLVIRPREGGATTRVELGHGDLAVMGGSCQRTHDHAIPKSTRSVGPRVSIQFRPAGVA